MVGALRTALLCSLMVLFSLWGASTSAQDAAPSAEAADTAVQETLAPLLEVLEDPAARDQLLEALRNAGAEVAPPADAAPEERPPLAARVAQTSVETVNELLGQGARIVNDIFALRVLPNLLTPERVARIQSEGIELGLTVLVTFLIYRGLRIVSRRVFARRNQENRTFSVLVLHFLVQIFLRLVSVLLAWIAGYGLAALVFSEGGIAVPQALYLNAFLVFGLFSVGLSVLVSRHNADLTFASLSPRAEGAIYRNVRRVAGVISYGLIAAVPIAQSWANFVVARSLRTIVLTLGAMLAFAAIYRISRVILAEKRVAAAPVQGTGEDTLTETLAGNSLRVWDRVWPWLAYLYVFVAYTVSMANPNMIVELVGRATILSALGLIALLFALRLFSLATQSLQLHLPGWLTTLLPSLGARLSTFVAPVLVLSGVGLLALSVALILDGWKLINLTGWLEGGGTDALWALANILLMLVILVAIWAVLSSWIDKRLSQELPESKQVSARSRTLLALFRNTVSIALFIFGGMTVLSEMGVDIAPLLAGAGVIGLAIGFGAQKLVQDIITGIFIQLENAINEGDVVTVAGVTGGVEKLTIRSVGLRDLSGVYHIIPFSAVDMVSNYMRRFGYHVEAVGVGYSSDLDAVKAALHRAYDTVKASDLGRDIIEALEYQGVIGLGDSSVNVRARIKTRPGKQWAIGRAYTQEVKRELDAAGIEIPFPHRELKLPDALLKRLEALDKPVTDGTA